MNDLMQWKEPVLFALAIYAAGLSTFNLRKALQKDRRSLKITMDTVMPTYGPQLGPPFVLLKATNAGHRPVSTTLLTLRLPDGKRLMPMNRDSFPGLRDNDFPTNLAEGESASRYFAYEDVAHALRSHGYGRGTKLTPVCEDSVGGSYRGSPWSVDPDEWLRMAAS